MMLTDAQPGLSGTLAEFPGDPSHDVCPTDAIAWDEVGEVPTIDVANCIGCGLCALHCPYGAISLSPEGVALVEGSDPDNVTDAETGAVQPHVATPRQGNLSGVEVPFAREMPKVTGKLNDIQGTRLARNMLSACGLAASMRRKGDTNVRMDGLLRFVDGQIGVVELETGSEMLELPRALLEDVAVLHNRFGVPIEEIVPVSVIGTLPNVRGEYYQVIDDIAKVLNIRLRTLTIGVVCMVMWRFKILDRLNRDLFTTKAGATNLHTSLVQLIPDLPAEEPYPGAYRPSK